MTESAEPTRPVIDDALLLHVARLARVAVPEARRAALAGELGRILEYVRVLERADDAQSPVPMIPADVVMRPDEVLPSLPREVALQQAPGASDAAFVVPKVVG